MDKRMKPVHFDTAWPESRLVEVDREPYDSKAILGSIRQEGRVGTRSDLREIPTLDSYAFTY
jgi:hypothetical protein